MREIIKTDDGYMVQLPSGDYLCDEKGDNLFDTFVEASALAWGLEKPTEEQIQSAKAHKAFYAWEESQYGGDSDLSDDHRMVWVKGYLQALRDASKPPCLYCGGNCPNDEDHACDGYLGDIDGLYAEDAK